MLARFLTKLRAFRQLTHAASVAPMEPLDGPSEAVPSDDVPDAAECSFTECEEDVRLIPFLEDPPHGDVLAFLASRAPTYFCLSMVAVNIRIPALVLRQSGALQSHVLSRLVQTKLQPHPIDGRGVPVYRAIPSDVVRMIREIERAGRPLTDLELLNTLYPADAAAGMARIAFAVGEGHLQRPREQGGGYDLRPIRLFE